MDRAESNLVMRKVHKLSSRSVVVKQASKCPFRLGIEDQLKKVKVPGPSALALSAL